MPCVETELPDEGGDLVAAELEPCGVAGAGCGGAVIEAEESGDGDWVVAPWVGADGGVGVGVADVVEVETVDVVAPEEVHGDVERVLLDGGVAWVEGVVGAVPLDPVVALGEPVGVGAVGMGRLGGQGRLGVPDIEGDDPCVDLERFRAGAGFGDEVGERVEGGGGNVGGAGFEAVAVVGVAAFSDLDEEGVAVGGAGVGDELGDLGGGFEA